MNSTLPNSPTHAVARVLWERRYGHPEVFDRCFDRRGGDTAETEKMYWTVLGDARAALDELHKIGFQVQAE